MNKMAYLFIWQLSDNKLILKMLSVYFIVNMEEKKGHYIWLYL